MLEFTVDKEKFVCLFICYCLVLEFLPQVYTIIKSQQESLVQFLSELLLIFNASGKFFLKKALTVATYYSPAEVFFIFEFS